MIEFVFIFFDFTRLVLDNISLHNRCLGFFLTSTYQRRILVRKNVYRQTSPSSNWQMKDELVIPDIQCVLLWLFKCFVNLNVMFIRVVVIASRPWRTLIP